MVKAKRKEKCGDSFNELLNVFILGSVQKTPHVLESVRSVG